jgi:hypothetical protein
VTVGNVMHKLAHRPAALAIGGVELGVIQARNSRGQAFGQLSKNLNMSGASIRATVGGHAKAPNRIAEIIQFSHGGTLAQNFRRPLLGNEATCDRCGYVAALGTAGPDGRKLRGRPGQVLGVVMNHVMCGCVMVVVVVMPGGSESRACKHHQEE